MAQPIATTQSGFICFAFPDVCVTPAAPSPVSIPYPNLGLLSDAQKVSDASTGTGEVKVGGKYVILTVSEIPTTTGDEPGTNSQNRGKVTFKQGSATVKIHGEPVVRMLDPTIQNNGNANGSVLGGVPNVLVGG